MPGKEKYTEEDALNEAEKMRQLVGKSGSAEDYKLAHETVIEEEQDREHDPRYIEKVHNREAFEFYLKRGEGTLPIKGSIFEEILFGRVPVIKAFNSKVSFSASSKFAMETIDGGSVLLGLINPDNYLLDFRVDFKARKLVSDFKSFSLTEEQAIEIKELLDKIDGK